MAEAIAAFSLAANVVQFIDFGARITGNFWSFYKAASGTDEDAPDVESINSDLQNILKDLQSSPAPDTNTGLARLTQECQKAAAELEKIFQPMVIEKKRQKENQRRRAEKDFVKSEKGFRKRAALKAAFKLAWNEDQIQSLKGKVDQFRSQLILHILASLRELAHESLSYQRKILDVVYNISQDSQDEGPVNDGFAIPFINFITSKLDKKRRENTNLQLQQEIQTVIYGSSSELIEASLLPTMGSSRREDLERRILSSFHYSGMEDRKHRITEAHGSTYQWIFKDNPHNEMKWANFRDWLQSDSQIYWITGKAGSGKSTLMKFICENTPYSYSSAINQSRCVEYLQSWARGEKLIIANFFFWNSSTVEQRTTSGLFRTLLYRILKQEPELIPVIVPKRWETSHLFNANTSDWSVEELSGMLRETVSQGTKTSRMCLFVDGLDEFDGDHALLIDLFKNLVTNPRIKLCLASRPWVEFEDGFKHSPSLMLQQLTYPDMREYVSSHMNNNEGFELLCLREPAYASQLVENIITKSSGVFLWVQLVVTSLLGGMKSGDRISDLQRRLDTLPPELEELYDRILSTLDPFYLEHATQLFKFIHMSLSPPLLLTLAFADEDNSFISALKGDVQPFSADQIEILQEAMRRRVNSRSKGLLEIGSDPRSRGGEGLPLDLERYSVQYLHRTVRDYMESPKVQDRLDSSMKSPYDAHLSHCIGILSFIKGTLPTTRLFRSQISAFLRYAKGIKEQNHAQLRELMGEFDRTCTVISSRVSLSKDKVFGWRSKNISWACLNPAEDPHCPFNCHILSLATRCGVFSYVRASAFEQGCIVPTETIAGTEKFFCVNREDRYPLLLDAVTRIPNSHWLPFTVPDLEMVTLLLEHGADPNMVVCSSSTKPFTIWCAALAIPRRIYHSEWSMSDNEEWREWLKVYKIMLEHGAGRFKGAARSKAKTNIDIMLSRTVFSYGDWRLITRQLREGREVPGVYFKYRY